MVVTTLFGYVVLACFFFTEGRIRSGQDAKSFKAGQFDQNTTRFIGLAFSISILAMLASWLLNFFQIGVLSGWIGWLGILLALFGVFIRWWANRALGAFYTRTLKVAENQTIIKNGPYRLIRHPGYLGSILMWSGVAAASTNWVVILIVLILMITAYYFRIENEEKMLLTTQAEYSEYWSHTWRLIPFIY
jgi:protein-S-isoprenylcysteine O-methyltransferase Ste14